MLDPAGIRLFPANNIGDFGPYERHLRAGGDHGAHWTGCPSGLWALGIEADGTLEGCPSLPTNPSLVVSTLRRCDDLVHLGPGLRPCVSPLSV
ncbi:MAG: hypothetical protein AAF799_48000 [Myxococcota bacterium]